MAFKFKAGYAPRSKRQMLTGKGKLANYKSWTGRKCMNPECDFGLGIEVHHINPVKHEGKNEYWNFISLCRKCHRHNRLHRDFESLKTMLFTWKCFAELNIFGFVLDETDENYYNRVRQLLLSNK